MWVMFALGNYSRPACHYSKWDIHWDILPPEQTRHSSWITLTSQLGLWHLTCLPGHCQPLSGHLLAAQLCFSRLLRAQYVKLLPCLCLCRCALGWPVSACSGHNGQGCVPAPSPALSRQDPTLTQCGPSRQASTSREFGILQKDLILGKRKPDWIKALDILTTFKHFIFISLDYE